MNLIYRLRGKGLGKIPGAKSIYKLLLPKESTLKRIKVLNFEMWVDLKDLGDLTPALITRGVYNAQMTQVVKETIKPGMNCVDVGANIGYYTILMSRLGGTVWAFEPEILNYNLLTKNLELNSTKNVYPVFGAISNTQKLGSLHVNRNFFGSHHLEEITPSKEVTTVEVDTLNTQLGNKKIDFVKVDTQGAEMQVLEGMDQVIKYNPDIIIVWGYVPSCLKRFNCKPIDFLLNLEGYGFKLWDIDEREKKVIPMRANQLVEKYQSNRGTKILVRR